MDAPNLLDYNGVSLSGASSSAAAFAQLVTDLNALRPVTSILPEGKIVLDGAATNLLMGGVNLLGQPGGLDFVQGASIGRGKIGTTFYIPASANNMVPRFALHRGSGLSNVNAFWPDQTSANGSYNWTTYPALIGTGPVVYAPFVVLDFNHLDSGAIGDHNGGSVRLHNIHMVGFYDGLYLRDPKVDGAVPWTSEFGSGFSDAVDSGMDVVSLDINNISGFGLRNAITIGRCSVLSTIDRVLLTNGHWSEASTEVGSPLIKWAQQNGCAFFIQSRWVGGRVSNWGLRQMRYAFRVSGNTPNGVGPNTQDDGRLNQFSATLGWVERVPTILRVESDAHLHNAYFECGGHCADDDDLTATHPVIDIQTNKAISGNFSGSTWVPIGDTSDVVAFFDLRIQESCGPLFQNTANDGHRVIKIRTPYSTYISKGNLALSAFRNLSPVTVMHHDGGHFIKGNGTRKLYSAVDARRLVVNDVSLHGTGPMVADDTVNVRYRNIDAKVRPYP